MFFQPWLVSWMDGPVCCDNILIYLEIFYYIGTVFYNKNSVLLSCLFLHRSITICLCWCECWLILWRTIALHMPVTILLWVCCSTALLDIAVTATSLWGLIVTNVANLFLHLQHIFHIHCRCKNRILLEMLILPHHCTNLYCNRSFTIVSQLLYQRNRNNWIKAIINHIAT